MNKRKKKVIENRKRLREWSKEIRAFGRCLACGAKKGIDAHHILPKERRSEYKFELFNGVPLCKKCHRFGKFSAHRNPLWFADFLKKVAPEKHDWAWSVMWK